MAHADTKPRISALELITSDLDDAQKTRRRHFMPALVIAGIMVVVTIVLMGVRPDLLELPPAQLALLAVLWVLCLGVFPAIGVGVLFLSTRARFGLAALAIAGTFSAITGWPFAAHRHVEHAGMEGTTMDALLSPCFGVALGAGVLVLAVGMLSGAFSQRRRFTAVYWVASGLALMSLNVATWHCPASGLDHVLPNHLGAALALMALAVVVGFTTRRRDTSRS